MRVLIIDNYDSFTFNLYQYVGELLKEPGKNRYGETKILVKRNNEISLPRVKEFDPQRILISPGPGHPAEPEYFGICSSVILELGKQIPLLGVCLGMQGITHLFGGKIIQASVPMHGKQSPILHDGEGVFAGLPQDVEVMRYHSLMADPAEIPDCLKVTAAACGPEDKTIEEALGGGGEIMGIRHREYPIEGIQFHPESFGTEGGMGMIKNFLFKG